MSILANSEVRRLMKVLRGKIEDIEKISFIEDELRGELGAEFLRESEVSTYFPNEIVEIVVLDVIWKLKIISYTRMRMIQRGISEKEVIALFESFLQFCADRSQIIIVGAYTIYGKAISRSSPLTLRMDVDEMNENEHRAHTVTVFVGRGDVLQTEEINLIS